MKTTLIALLLLLSLGIHAYDKKNISRANSLFKTAKVLEEKKEFEQAINLYSQSDSIYRIELPATDTLHLRGTKGLVQCLIAYSKNEEGKSPENAIKITEWAERLQLDNFGKMTDEYVEILIRKAISYIAIKEYDKAISFGTEATGISKTLYDEKGEKYAIVTYFLAHTYFSANKLDEAIKYGEEAVTLLQADAKSDKLNLAYAINNLATSYEKKGLILKAAELMEISLPIFKERLNKHDIQYARMSNNAAVIYSQQGRFRDAVRLGEESVEAAKKAVGTEDEIYLKCKNDLASFYSGLNDNQKAIKIMSELLEHYKNKFGDNHIETAFSRNNLAMYHMESGDNIKALELFTQNIYFYIENAMVNDPNYARCLMNLSSCMNNMGDVKTAANYCEEARSIYIKEFGTDHPYYIRATLNLAGYYSALGDNPKAIEEVTQILPQIKNNIGENSSYFVWALNDLSCYYDNIGDTKTAIKICEEALSISNGKIDETQTLYTSLLNNIAGLKQKSGDIEGAIKTAKEVLAILKRTVGENHPDYALTLNNIGNYHYMSGDIMTALDYFIKALEIQSNTSIIHYTKTLQNIARCMADAGEHETAINYTKDCLKEIKDIYGDRHEEYASSLMELVTYSLMAGDTANITSPFNEIFDIRSQLIREMFSKLTAKERELYWQSHLTFFEEEVPFLAYYVEDQELINTAYNSALLSKGVLLDTELAMEELMHESGDSAVISQYNKLKHNRILLNKLHETPVASRKLNADSLARIINRQEKQLIKESKAYGDYTHKMSITWNDVKDKLKADDIAIEFKHFNAATNNDVIYVALLLKKNYEHPKMVHLFKQKELDEIEKSDIYDTDQLYNMMWSPLADELKGVKNIYFAPTGSMHSIAIESLPVADQYINDTYNLYRLSSTRELVLKHTNNSIKNVALYGGLLYDADTLKIAQENRQYNDSKTTVSLDLNYIAQRGGASYLPATLHEVDNINTLFKQKRQINTICYTGIKGTEESLKSLGGKGLDLLHIATHGLYWSEDKVHWMKDKSFLQQDNSDNAGIEDKALVRSGLLFSGANHTLKGKPMTSTADDGVLTAKELANINFRNLKLATLSACQSGLGDITGEGVFGMQRGFKKAGAKTLLMSLWKVDDVATALLMSEFYRNLIKGKSIYDALRNAQQYLRNYETNVGENTRKYSSPYFWAAFVLLDAM